MMIKMKVMEDHLLLNNKETTMKMLKVHNLNLNNVKLMVDKIFRIHNFSEAKKVAMASLEFEGYANVWWEEVNKKREKEDLAPIDTWEEMQEVMHTRLAFGHLLTKTNKSPKWTHDSGSSTSVKTQAMESKPMERELEMMKMELQRAGRNFRPPGPELPPPRTGTSALQDRNFRPDAAKIPFSAQRSGASRNFRPEGPELPPTRNFRSSSAQVPKVRQNAPGCYCKEMG
ncbi:hypothetical protein QYE76_027068 [Lolium multiflorum]|uniref:Retrotransposon gag domain-containing protein n=1 Tax=Lolium multiflorum TaxID=4521 RepID=A0AAD8QIT8_LOLMU|nr:hypothetical protein QYE76_027068 [Lolium multiflorum]